MGHCGRLWDRWSSLCYVLVRPYSDPAVHYLRLDKRCFTAKETPMTPTTPSRRLRFGIKTAPQHAAYDSLLRVWREAEAEPIFEHAWLFDHFIPIGGNPVGPCFEGWTLLAAFAALTQRLRLGLMVTGNTYRHPAVLPKMAATVDVISGVPLHLGIGAGW